MKSRALLIDPGRTLLNGLGPFLKEQGFEVEEVSNREDALARIGANHYPFVLYDLSAASAVDLDFICELETRAMMPRHILVTGPDEVPTAVRALQNGARHYWTRPVSSVEVERFLRETALTLDRRNEQNRQSTLLQIIKEIALTMEMDGLVNILMDSAMELAGADGGALLLLDEKSNVLVPKAFRGLSAKDLSPDYFGLPEKRYYDVLSARQPVFLRQEDLQWTPNDQQVQGMILSPIWHREQALGALVLVKFHDGSPSFSNDDFKLISMLTVEIAGAVFNAILHYKTKELTIKDDLTEAYNRRYLEHYLEEEIQRARRFNSNLSLIFFDVDNLKEVNVKYGHLTGSKTLQEIAHRMILAVRGIDKVVRYGGDEFCVVLPETDAQGAHQVADRIRNIVATQPFQISDTVEAQLTGSIGIASFPTHASTKDELIRQADHAMLSIKNKSKNAIAVADSPP